MKNKALQILAILIAACPVVGLAQAPKDGVYISDEDVKAVLKHALDTKRTIPDNTIRVIDMDNYQLGVAVIHRGAMGRRRWECRWRRDGGKPRIGMRRATSRCDGSHRHLPRRYGRELRRHIG